MSKINTDKWKEYKVGDLFDIYPTKSYKLNNSSLFEKDGVNPVIVNSSFNNGIGGYTNLPTTEEGHIITFSDTTTATAIFYQDKPFVGYSHVQGMYPSEKYKEQWTESSLLFFLSVFKSVATNSNFNYVNKFTRKTAEKMIIRLPADRDGNPDFAYMESYMKDIKSTVSSSLTKLQSAKNCSHKTCVLDWKRFSMVELGFSIYHGTRIKKSDRIDGNTIFVTAGKENQGVIGKIGNSVSEWLDPITVDMFGNCFYHDYKCFGDDNIYAFINNKLNKYHKWFIASVIDAENSAIFSYANQFRQNNADKLSVLLPQTSSGEPDWDYMEQYIKNIEISANNSLNMLQSVLN